MLDTLIDAVRPADPAATAAATAWQSTRARPPGSLGRLEALGVRLAGIARACPPPVPAHPIVVVAAADHGVHVRGVSDWPQEVTAAMVDTVASGGATVNAIARAVGADVALVDVGTARPGPLPHGVVDRRVRAGTRDLVVEPAMTLAECETAIGAGAEIAHDVVDAGADLVVLGDLGIANTTASTCLVSAFTGADPQATTGRGANRDHARVPHKVATIRAALERHGPGRDPLATLASLGGLEHAALVGVTLAAAARRVPVVLDGLITDAAALAAAALAPAVADHLVAGHRTAEPGGAVALEHLGVDALLDLGLCLGEGTGGLLAVPLVQSAARALGDVDALHDVVGRAPGHPGVTGR